MAFTFEITRVDKLPSCRVGILDGKVIDGKIAYGTEAELVHEGQRFPMLVTGIGLDGGKRPCNTLSLSVDIRRAGMEVVQAGDLLVYDGPDLPLARKRRWRV